MIIVRLMDHLWKRDVHYVSGVNAGTNEEDEETCLVNYSTNSTNLFYTIHSRNLCGLLMNSYLALNPRSAISESDLKVSIILCVSHSETRGPG